LRDFFCAASKLGDPAALEQTVQAVIDDLHAIEPLVEGGRCEMVFRSSLC
jgi:hypothetical protein